MKTKPFNLEEALKFPDRVVCWDGVKPTEIHYFTEEKCFAVVRHSGAKYFTDEDGRHLTKDINSGYDLLLSCETKQAKLVPFTYETFFPHKDRWIRRDDGLIARPAAFGGYGVIYMDGSGHTMLTLWYQLLSEFTFEDGTPCGVEVEE